MGVFDDKPEVFIQDAAREAHAVKAAIRRILDLGDPDDFVRANMEILDKRMLKLVHSLENFYATQYSR